MSEDDMDPQNASTRAFTGDRSPARAAVDNLMRRSLKISNPYDPVDVVKGLLARYGDEAEKIKRERLGLPFSLMQAQPPAAPKPNGTGRPEMRRATDTLEAALKELTTSPDLADIQPELSGWASMIRRASADGFASAAYAIDASERDRAFGARRSLGEFARLARYAAAVNSCATETYCRVAQACDLAANVMLVLIGDALGDAGITRSGGILQVTAATLESRRNGVVEALHNLLAPNAIDDQDTLPRAQQAVLDIYDKLEEVGSPDLRVLLDEAYLARQLDDLVDLAAGSTSDGLRALGTASAVIVQRLERFLIIAEPIVVPPAPPASVFFAELRLFTQGFEASRSGYRLPYLARSPLLVSGVAAGATFDQPTQTLLDIALDRTALADKIDCLCCSCDAADAEELVLGAKILFDVDRAIDLYGLGTHPTALGEAELRGAAFGKIIKTATTNGFTDQEVIDLLEEIAELLQEATIGAADPRVVEIVNLQIADEKRWGGLVSSIAPSCHQKLLFQDFVFTPGSPRPDPDRQENPIGKLLAKMIGAAHATTPPKPLDFSGELADFQVTRTIEDSLAKIADRSNSFGSSTPAEQVESQPESRARAVRRRRTRRKR
jgi:hypothetical protein